MGGFIEVEQADGGSNRGYLAETAERGAPGVVVIQEWWGLQDQITGICDRLAAAGYHALAPDLYGGEVAPYHDTVAAEAAMNALDVMAATEGAVAGAARRLAANGAKVGLTGFCLGGLLAVLGAIRVPGLAAAVCFYGLPSPEMGAPGDIEIPFQAHFANHDDWCTPAAVDAFEAGLGADTELHRYDAKHGFMNEQQPSIHDAAAARLAWQRMLDFWRRHLSQPGGGEP
jgi:carboxymethylenebutenolidase